MLAIVSQNHNICCCYFVTNLEPPVLRTLSTPLVAVEGSPFSYTDIVQAPGFPHLPSYQWTHNGVAINTTTSTNPNVSVYPNIVFSSVVRTQSGNYSMTASTEGGDSIGYFILDVHCECHNVCCSVTLVIIYHCCYFRSSQCKYWSQQPVLCTSRR